MRIDLNADLGEGFGVWRLGDDDALLEVVSSANVACGFHAGDPRTMRRVCAGAAAHGVAVGAQVSYRDLAGFGRRRIVIDPDDLAADVLYQIGALDACARGAGTRVRYVKPHGALYNTAADDEQQAAAVVAGIAAFDAALPLLALPDSAMAAAAGNAGVPFVAEAFADRGYLPTGRLVPRGTDGAVLDGAEEIAQRVVRMVRDHRVPTTEGADREIDAASVCVHGDTPGAVEIARQVRQALLGAGVSVEPFVD
ncbi:LamB/YcsF family protein [uncultured Jatrophihabitans sp.]|uniref:LamB/YcsF family protein n=1 Tax=uncultured Jatrophihabitans sp. TaxID=1610747 RepID=UPI0035CC04CF